eukprot:scaffold120968_cov14-Tisochrysis_lutea.AAC.1
MTDFLGTSVSQPQPVHARLGVTMSHPAQMHLTLPSSQTLCLTPSVMAVFSFGTLGLWSCAILLKCVPQQHTTYAAGGLFANILHPTFTPKPSQRASC